MPVIVDIIKDGTGDRDHPQHDFTGNCHGLSQGWSTRVRQLHDAHLDKTDNADNAIWLAHCLWNVTKCTAAWMTVFKFCLWCHFSILDFKNFNSRARKNSATCLDQDLLDIPS